MKYRFFTIMLLLVLLVGLTGNAQATPTTALVYVKLSSQGDMQRFATTQLPLYTRLEAGLLTEADQAGELALSRAGLSYQVLDRELQSGTYYLVQVAPSRKAPDFTSYGRILLRTDNNLILLRMSPAQADALAQAGAELSRITLTPKPLPAAVSQSVFPKVIDPDPIIQGMMDQVTQEQVYDYDLELAGYQPVWVDGAWYTIPSRYTNSGTPIQKTTHYVGQHMADLGMDVEYHVWDDNTNPNVIGEIPGAVNPDDIFMIGAHIDDVQGTPGADDNASGSVATLLAADILSQYQWGCTLRFAFWTGEEQGLLGSSYYAQRAYQQGENILGYLNLDMIAWNTLGSDPYINLIYSSQLPPTHDLALLFDDVVSTYNLGLLTRFGTDLWGSDHNSFWDYGFTSILGIEDDLGNDFNPYYHQPGDTPIHTDSEYFTDFVKASVATYAIMNGCLIRETVGALNGHVTAAGSGTPLENASIVADDGEGNTYPTITDPSGYYTMTLPMDTYTVTVSLDGYVSQAQGASIIGGQVTTLDFALQPVCEPVSALDFTWIPAGPYHGEAITFTATANGSQPIDFAWDFGDTYTATGATVEHSYILPDTYTVALSATNACGSAQVSKDVTVLEWIWDFFLPLVHK